VDAGDLLVMAAWHPPPASFGANSTDVSWKNTHAATSALLAGSPLVEAVTGRYFDDCRRAGPHRPGARRGVAAHALDPDKAARLWRPSTDLPAGRETVNVALAAAQTPGR
jgi:hypothetical protein